MLIASKAKTTELSARSLINSGKAVISLLFQSTSTGSKINPRSTIIMYAQTLHNRFLEEHTADCALRRATCFLAVETTLLISKPKSFPAHGDRYAHPRYQPQMTTEKQVLYNTNYIRNTYHILNQCKI